jgi:transposase
MSTKYKATSCKDNVLVSSVTQISISVVEPKPDAFIGIDFHKRYSVFHVVDAEGKELAKGRIEHHSPEAFLQLVKRWQHPRVVFEATMNWHWLFEIVETVVPTEDIVMANPAKTRIIAEAQVKTDKIDARILAQLLRADLISRVHIPAKPTRERKEVLRQRCFFVRQRTMLRNRIHRLLGGQHDLVLPQCSDLFGNKGMGFLEKLQLPNPAGMLLKQQLAMLKNVKEHIKADEMVLSEMMSQRPEQAFVQSIPGMGPILAAVVVNEVDDVGRFLNAQKFCGYAGLCPSTSSSGGKTYNGRLMRHCNKWLRWAFVEAAWVSIGCCAYFANIYQRKRANGKKANTAILCVARRMARIAWQLLTQCRVYESLPPSKQHRGQRAGEEKTSPVATKEVGNSASAKGKRRKPKD